jgi:class 3 adenylate cyclase
MPATRRLAAILAADVAGYSRLIGADEQGTLARLKAIRTELIDPAVAGHNGRITKRPAMAYWPNSPAQSMPWCALRRSRRAY